MSSLTELLKLTNNYKTLVNPAIQELIESNGKIRASIGSYDLMQPYLDNIKRMEPFLDAFEKTESASRTIKAAMPMWDLISFHTVNYDDFIAQYYPVLSKLEVDVDSDILLNEKQTGFVEAEYELIYESKEAESTEETTSRIIDESQKIKQLIFDIYQNNMGLLQLEPRQFEEVIAELLRGQGLEAKLTKQTRDGGYDIHAILNLKGHAPQLWLVECKRFTSRAVGIEIVRAFKEVVESKNANRGIIATTSYFARDARKKRQETPYLLDLKDKNDIMRWITSYANSGSLF